VIILLAWLETVGGDQRDRWPKNDNNRRGANGMAANMALHASSVRAGSRFLPLGIGAVVLFSIAAAIGLITLFADQRLATPDNPNPVEPFPPPKQFRELPTKSSGPGLLGMGLAFKATRPAPAKPSIRTNLRPLPLLRKYR